MLYSMTGYGKASGTVVEKNILIEVKSLNGKYLDIYFKLPAVYKSKEIELRQRLSTKLLRGKVDFQVTIEDNEGSQAYSINKTAVKAYLNQLIPIGEEYNLGTDNLLNAVLRIPNVAEPAKGALSDEEWKGLLALIDQAVDNLMRFRKTEGESLERDLKSHAANIRTYAAEIKKENPLRFERMREKLKTSVQDLIKSENIDENRFEQEVVYYLEKLDINEELVRLESHCTYFANELALDGKTKGKKLGFISQEIGREINTIGAKASDSTIQTLVVKMKDELEKIKEQVMNVL